MTTIKTAARLEGISEYYFASKLREIAELRAKGQDIINLGIGSPDLPPHESVISVLSDTAQHAQAHGYQSYTGTPALRDSWATWYQRFYQVPLNPNGEILPLIGSKEGILHIAMTFLEAGDIALVPNPGYPTYKAASLLAGASVEYYDLDAANNWQPDFEALAKRDLRNVKIMWANYPHMPTGAPASEAVFKQLIAFGKQHQILIVNDNPYSFILNDRPQSILKHPEAFDIAIELNSLSKSHNMAGWRIGAVVGNSAYLSAILRFKSNMDSGQFLPLQQAAIQALSLDDAWHSSLNAIYKIRQKAAFSILDAIHCQYNPHQQGMFVWAKIPDRWKDGYELSDHLLYHAQVFLTPGGIFGTAGEQYVRISLCQDSVLFQQALQRILAQ